MRGGELPFKPWAIPAGDTALYFGAAGRRACISNTGDGTERRENQDNFLHMGTLARLHIKIKLWTQISPIPEPALALDMEYREEWAEWEELRGNGKL